MVRWSVSVGKGWDHGEDRSDSDGEKGREVMVAVYTNEEVAEG